MDTNKPTGQVLRDPQGKQFRAFCVYDPQGELKGWMLDMDDAKQVSRGFQRPVIAAPEPEPIESIAVTIENAAPLPPVETVMPKRTHRKSEPEDGD